MKIADGAVHSNAGKVVTPVCTAIKEAFAEEWRNLANSLSESFDIDGHLKGLTLRLKRLFVALRHVASASGRPNQNW